MAFHYTSIDSILTANRHPPLGYTFISAGKVKAHPMKRIDSVSHRTDEIRIEEGRFVWKRTDSRHVASSCAVALLHSPRSPLGGI
jgi:hypothetical protein